MITTKFTSQRFLTTGSAAYRACAQTLWTLWDDLEIDSNWNGFKFKAANHSLSRLTFVVRHLLHRILESTFVQSFVLQSIQTLGSRRWCRFLFANAGDAPRVILDASQLYALLRAWVQQLRYQAFEILGDLFVGYFLPVLLSLFRVTQLRVEIIVHGGILKGKSTNHNYEKHYSELKHVCRTAVVDFFVEYFGSHVHLGAVEGIQFLYTLRCAESKIC